jgi:7-cyano-7-deazaguanine synthase in queuosine biosynthesis
MQAGKKRICVLWSGGADSTYLVEQCLADEQYEVVLAGYVHVGNNQDKADSEIDALAKKVPILRARDDRYIWLGTLLSISIEKTNPNLAFKQPPIWLLAMVEAIHPEVEEVALGYEKGGDIEVHWPDIERIWAAYQPLMHRPMPRLVFPLRDLPKDEIMRRLSPELKAHCVYCEKPLRDGSGYRACGRCRTCEAHRLRAGAG